MNEHIFNDSQNTYHHAALSTCVFFLFFVPYPVPFSKQTYYIESMWVVSAWQTLPCKEYVAQGTVRPVHAQTR